jgi:hypothetical protein
MNRFKAAGIHVTLSIFIVTSVLLTMYLLWYPSAYFTLMGGRKLITLIGFVDIFLGPLLTLIVFKSGKKSLKFDLFCIAIVQVAALSYGVYVIVQSRPVFTVFNKDKFQIAAVVDITPKELAKAKEPEWRQFSIKGPVLVAIANPDKKDRKETVFAMVVSDYAYHYPRLYDHYKKHRDEIIRAGKPLTKLSEGSVENKATIDSFIKTRNRPENDFLFLPISTEFAEMSVIVDAKTGDLIEIVNAIQKTK